MRTIVFKLGTRSRAELKDFLHSQLNFEFNDIAWLDADGPRRDRVSVRFWNDLHALRALVLWSMHRRRPQRVVADTLRPQPRLAALSRLPPQRVLKLHHLVPGRSAETTSEHDLAADLDDA